MSEDFIYLLKYCFRYAFRAGRGQGWCLRKTTSDAHSLAIALGADYLPGIRPGVNVDLACCFNIPAELFYA